MAKRGNGEGSIGKAADGRWWGRATVDGKRKVVYGKTRAEADKKLRELLAARDHRLPVIDGRLMVATFLDDWLAAVKPTVKPRTYTRYEQYVRCHLVPGIGKLPLAKLEAHHLSRLYSALAEKRSAQTVKHVHTVLHTALTYAVKTGKAVRNAADIAEPPRVRKHEMAYLTREQTQQFLAAAAGDRLEALYVLAVTTGMRQGELLGLRWADVDLEGTIVPGTPTLYVRASLQRTKDGFTLEEPKTARSRRRVELHSGTVAALRKHRRQQAEERLKAGADWDEQDLVFCNALGRPIEAGNLLRRSYWPLLKQAELARIPFHSLRHTAVTLMIQDGVDIPTVARVVGRASPSVTADRYSHVTPTMTSRAVRAMDALFGT